mmetsp:Transcript_21500/g.40322  ORF Transcript_21500/g.40322 Transcript_21500/m.40322 type:complete len:166 (+) Transcript_21500:92-589(+)
MARGHRLLPRVILILYLFKIGSDFLTVSMTQADAILNSLALTFIVEIDEMIFTAIVSFWRQKLVTMFNPLEVPNSWYSGLGPKYWSQTSFHLSAVLIVAFGFSAVQRTRPYGWLYQADALSCFCEGIGATCIQHYEWYRDLGVKQAVPDLGRPSLLSQIGWANFF